MHPGNPKLIHLLVDQLDIKPSKERQNLNPYKELQ